MSTAQCVPVAVGNIGAAGAWQRIYAPHLSVCRHSARLASKRRRLCLFVSRSMRQTELDQYTPAVPTQVQPAAMWTGEDGWVDVQKQLYRDLCEVAFDTVDSHEFADAIHGVISKFPAYPEEIREVVEYFAAELEVVNSQDDDGQWSNATLEAMTLACSELVQEVSEARPQKVSELEKAQTFEIFHAQLLAVDWEKLVTDQLPKHGTRPSVLFILSTTWEAEWKICREALGSSAVLDKPLSLLPQALQEAWQAMLSGQRALLRAPEAF